MTSSSRGEKRTYISISSSSSSESESEYDEYNSQSESEKSEGIGEVEEIAASTSSDDDDEESDDEGESHGSFDRVNRRFKDKSDLQELKLKDCHSYLRHHGLRITGTNSTIKDGNAEALYPRSSFFLDCTGDVCRGDVVMFKQKAKKYNKRRSKQFPCIRTVAGKVVRESYGVGAQQHTFTIEVLWSKACKGVEQLPLLSYLLVKGRKLYKMRTFRQLWKNESERHDVLAEKHERGDIARLTRAMNRAMEKTCSKNKGNKHQKQSLHSTPSTSGKRADAKRENRKRTKKEKLKSTKHRKKVSRDKLKKKSQAKTPESSAKQKNSTHPRENKSSIAQTHHYPSQTFHQTQTNPIFSYYPHQPLHNYNPISYYPPFRPQNFHQSQLNPNFPHHPHNYQDANSQLYPYPPQNLHPYHTHYDNIISHPHHPQSSQQSQMQYHQPLNGNCVSPYYKGPPVIHASQDRGFNHVYGHNNMYGPRNVNSSRSWDWNLS